MSDRPADLFLADIRESIARIERYSAGLDRAGFEGGHIPTEPWTRTPI